MAKRPLVAPLDGRHALAQDVGGGAGERGVSRHAWRFGCAHMTSWGRLALLRAGAAFGDPAAPHFLERRDRRCGTAARQRQLARRIADTTGAFELAIEIAAG